MNGDLTFCGLCSVPVPAKPKQTWKEKKKERKMHRNNYELIVLAKRIWEDLRKYVIVCGSHVTVGV